MESAGTEPFSAHKSLFQAADGGARWHAHLRGHLSHPVLLLSVDGRTDAHSLVAVADVDGQTGFPVAKNMGAADVCACNPVAADFHGHGLLDLYPQTARPFLRRHIRSLVCDLHAVGIPLPAREISPEGRSSGTYCRHRLSAVRHLRAGGYPADGYLQLAAGVQDRECRL